MRRQIELRTIAGILSGSAAFATTLLQSIVAVPILLSIWGAENYGIWLAVSTTVALLTTLDIGHQTYVGNTFNQDLPKGASFIKDRLASGIKGSLLIGAVQVGLAILIIKTHTLARLISISEEKIHEHHIDWAFLSMIINWALCGSIPGLLSRIYSPYGRFAESQWIGVLQRIAQFGMIVLVAGCGGFIFTYSMGMWIFCGIFMAIWLPAVRRAFPNLYPWWKGGSWRQAGYHLSRSSVLTLNNFIIQLSLNGLTLVIATQFNAATVPLFTTARTVANTFSQASMVLTNPLLPDLVRFHVRQEKEKLMQAFQACWFSGGAIINLGIIAVVPFIPWLYRLWTHGRLEFNLPLFSLLAWSVAIRSAYSPLSSYVSGLNRLRAQFIVNTVQTGITVGLPLLLSRQMGLAAFGLGVVVGEIWAAGAYCWYASQEIEAGLTFFARAYLLQALLPVMVVGSVLASTWSGSETVIISATVVGLLLLAVFYAFTWIRLPDGLQSRFVRLLPPAFQNLLPRPLK